VITTPLLSFLNTVNMNKVTVNDFSIPVEEDTPESMWAKIIAKRGYTSYPAWMEKIVLPADCKPSHKSHDACYTALLQNKRSIAGIEHPINKPGDLLEKGDITVSPMSIKTETDKYEVKGGFIDLTRTQIQAAVASSVAAYVTNADGNGVDDKVYAKGMNMPSVRVSGVRAKIFKNMESSTYLAMNHMYESIVYNEEVTVRALSAVATAMPNKSLNIAESEKYGAPIYFVSRFQEPLNFTTDVKVAWRYLQTCMAGRGSTSGTGGISVGYTMFFMNKREANAISMVRDILNVMNRMKVTHVKLPSNLDNLVVHSLSKQVRVCADLAMASEYENEPGLYDSFPADVNYATMINVDHHSVAPITRSTGIEFLEEAEKKVYRKLRITPLSFAYVPLTTTIPEDIYLFPASMSDKLQVIASFTDLGCKHSVQDHVERATMAISSRNYFPIYFRPFWMDDPMADYVQWDTPIRIGGILPKTKIKAVIEMESTEVERKLEPLIDDEIRKDAMRDKETQAQFYRDLPQIYKAIRASQKTGVEAIDRHHEQGAKLVELADLSGVSLKDLFKMVTKVEEVPKFVPAVASVLPATPSVVTIQSQPVARRLVTADDFCE